MTETSLHRWDTHRTIFPPTPLWTRISQLVTRPHSDSSSNKDHLEKKLPDSYKLQLGPSLELKTNHKGQTKNFFIQGLYLYPKTAQSTRTGDVWHTSEGEGEFSDSKLQVYYFTYESPNLFIKNPDINSRIYEAPNAMTPSCFSVLQYSTLQTHSKGQNTFPSKFH